MASPRHLTFIDSIGPSVDVVAQTDPRQAPASYRCVLSGLQAGPALISQSRGFTVRDREGNLWSFGTYTGE